MEKRIKLIRSLKVNLVPLSHHLGLNKFGWERIGLNVKLCLMLLKLNLLVSGTLIVVSLDTWNETFSFTSLENYNGGTVTFGDGNLTHVKGKDNIVIHGCPKLDEVICIERLKANLLSINQKCGQDHKVNFHQDLCEVVNKECKVVITWHKIIDNYYAINPNFRMPFVCIREKLDPIEL